MVFFKSSKREKKSSVALKAAEDTQVTRSPNPKEQEEKGQKVGRQNIAPELYSVLKRHCISEKASIENQRNVYVFEVIQGATKGIIKNAVEKIYGVNVKTVRVAKTPPKARRLGRSEGFRRGFSKAYVTVREGQKIDLGIAA